MGIYLDNACTSSPKPPCVAKAVAAFLSGGAFNVNRGSYEGALDAEDAVLGCRELLAGLLGAPDPRNVVFTSGDTEAINLVLRGLLSPGDHVVVSSMEHNAVMRPLTSLARAGVTFARVACAPDGTLDPADVAAAMEPKTRLVIMTHASTAPTAPRPPVALPWSQVLSSSLPLPLRTRLGASARRAPLKGEPWRLLMHEA